ncbi:hypothetical protein HQ520_11510 [bacterium]|nr:hypothetical protein [bacterium]
MVLILLGILFPISLLGVLIDPLYLPTIVVAVLIINNIWENPFATRRFDLHLSAGSLEGPVVEGLLPANARWRTEEVPLIGINLAERRTLGFVCWPFSSRYLLLDDGRRIVLSPVHHSRADLEQLIQAVEERVSALRPATGPDFPAQEALVLRARPWRWPIMLRWGVAVCGCFLLALLLAAFYRSPQLQTVYQGLPWHMRLLIPLTLLSLILWPIPQGMPFPRMYDLGLSDGTVRGPVEPKDSVEKRRGTVPVREIDLKKSRLLSDWLPFCKLFFRMNDGRRLVLSISHHSSRDIRRFVEAVEEVIARDDSAPPGKETVH